jgi:hypothetical protein
MQEALDAFGRLVDYEVGEVTAAATFYMAEIYRDLSRALIESERPGDLDASELQDYEMALEQEAFPFEEKAIEVHEKNLELMAEGVFNPWIERSLDSLAKLMPGRYAKSEASSGWIDSVDTYAYRAPKPPAPAVDATEIAERAASAAGPATIESAPVEVPPAAPDPGADASPSVEATGQEGDANAR